MILYACDCADYFGTTHTHLTEWRDDPDRGPGKWPHDTGEIQVWIDWRAAYKALGNDGHDDDCWVACPHPTPPQNDGSSDG